jgi:hypothetical protein
VSDAASILYGGPTAAAAPAPAAAPADGTATAAERLYGGPTQAEATPVADNTAAEPATADTAPTAMSPEAVAQATEQIASRIPADIKELRSDPARKMYSAQVEFKSISDAAFVSKDIPAELAPAVAAELREVLADVGFKAQDLPDLVHALERQPTTPQAIADAHDRAVELLNAEFGQNAKQALRDARAYIAADPRRLQLFEAVGNDPRTVLRVAQLAQAAKRRA